MTQMVHGYWLQKQHKNKGCNGPSQYTSNMSAKYGEEECKTLLLLRLHQNVLTEEGCMLCSVCIFSLTGLPVALKEIRLEHEEGAPCTALRESELLMLGR